MKKQNNFPKTLISNHRLVYLIPKNYNSSMTKIIFLQIPALQQSSSDVVSQEENAWHKQHFNLLLLGFGHFESHFENDQQVKKYILDEKIGPSHQNKDLSKAEELLKRVLPSAEQEQKTLLKPREFLSNYQVNLAVDTPLPHNASTARIDDWQFINEHFSIGEVPSPIVVRIKEKTKKKKADTEKVSQNNNNNNVMPNNTTNPSMFGFPINTNLSRTFSMHSTQVHNQTAIQVIQNPSPSVLNPTQSLPPIAQVTNQAAASLDSQNTSPDWLVIASENVINKMVCLRGLNSNILMKMRSLGMEEKHYHTLNEYCEMAKLNEVFLLGEQHAKMRELLRSKFNVPAQARLLFVRSDIAMKAYEALVLQHREILNRSRQSINPSNNTQVEDMGHHNLQLEENQQEVELSQITYEAFTEILHPSMIELTKLLNNYDSVKHICRTLLEKPDSNFKFYLMGMSADSLLAINKIIDDHLRKICENNLFGECIPGLKQYYFQRYFQENVMSNVLKLIVEDQPNNISNNNAQNLNSNSFAEEKLLVNNSNMAPGIAEQPLNNNNVVKSPLKEKQPLTNNDSVEISPVKENNFKNKPLKKPPLIIPAVIDDEDDDTPLAQIMSRNSSYDVASLLINLSKSSAPSVTSGHSEKLSTPKDKKEVLAKTPKPSAKRKQDSVESHKKPNKQEPAEKKMKKAPGLGKVFTDLRKIDQQKTKNNNNNNNIENNEFIGMRKAAVKATMELTKNSRKVSGYKKTALKIVGDIEVTPPSTPPSTSSSPKL